MLPSTTNNNLIVGQVVETHLNNEGVGLYVVTDFAGNYLYPVIQMSLIGGLEGSFTCSAIRNGSRVIVAQIERTFYILGTIADAEDSECFSADGIKSAVDAEVSLGKYDRVTPDVKQEREAYEINADYSDVHLNECHIENDDNFVNLSSVHGITLEGSPRVSVQIPNTDDAIFRVSAGGEAVNRVLNADPFLDRLFNHINLMEQKVRALENYCVALQSALVGLNAGPTAPVGVAVTPVVPKLNAVTAIALSESNTVRSESNNDINSKVQIP